jgi:hypothetical protein
MANQDYRPPLRGFVALIVKLLTQLAGMFTNRIKDEEVRLMATGFIDGTKKSVEALSDADPNDKEQIRAIFNKLLSEGPFQDGSPSRDSGEDQRD